MKYFITLVMVFTLQVGQSQNFKPLSWKDGSPSVMYCGKPSNYVFSIASDDGRSSVNLYFHISSREIIISDRKYKVIKVNPEQITLKQVVNNET